MLLSAPLLTHLPPRGPPPRPASPVPGLPLDWPAYLPGCELTSLSWLSSIQQPRLVRRPSPWSASVNICVRRCQRALHPRSAPLPTSRLDSPNHGSHWATRHLFLSLGPSVSHICTHHARPCPHTLLHVHPSHTVARTHTVPCSGGQDRTGSRQPGGWEIHQRCSPRCAAAPTDAGAVRPWPCVLGRAGVPCLAKQTALAKHV